MYNQRRGVIAPPPGGFTIVELLVAMTLVAIGLLSLVGANTAFIRRRNEAHQRLAAVAVATNRVALLSNGPCLPTTGNSALSSSIAERWWVILRGNATREIVDSVRFGVRPVHDVVVRTQLPC